MPTASRKGTVKYLALLALAATVSPVSHANTVATLYDPYEVLGVSYFATDEEIKAAYKALIRKLHPDSHGGSNATENQVKAINNARDDLLNPSKRWVIDESLGIATFDPRIDFKLLRD